MNRHGVLTKDAVAAEGVAGGFATLYKVLSAFEDAGRCQRGYFIESLGGAQFAVASTVDRLRSYLDGVDPEQPDYWPRPKDPPAASSGVTPRCCEFCGAARWPH